MGKYTEVGKLEVFTFYSSGILYSLDNILFATFSILWVLLENTISTPNIEMVKSTEMKEPLWYTTVKTLADSGLSLVYLRTAGQPVVPHGVFIDSWQERIVKIIV